MSKTVNWYGDKFVRFRIVGDKVEIDLRDEIVTKELGIAANLEESTKLHYLLGMARITIIDKMLVSYEGGIKLEYNKLLIKIYYRDYYEEEFVIPEKYSYLLPLLLDVESAINDGGAYSFHKFSLLAAALDVILFDYIE